MTNAYQLSTTRTPGRYTDPEWKRELKAIQARNANYRLSYANFATPAPVKRYVAWLDKAGK